ncbi:MAG TPA: amidohydrolase family protein [Candidatus Binataceae bacterium]|nr:amidohydrolase family protein [Candidatus Binataceae bacterium]
MRVDVHAHLFPAAYRAVMQRLGGETTRYPLGSDAQEELDARFEMMDGAGVDLQVLSVASALPYFERESNAIDGARAANDLYAEFVARYPGRFRAFAVTPLPHVDAALAEMARALDQLKMVGVTLGSSVMNRSAADPAFDPLWAELNRRAATLFVHPAGLGLCSPLVRDYGLTWPVGAPFEDTMFAMHVIQRQLPVRYPKIKIIVPHFGGVMPLVLPRIDQHEQLFMKEGDEPPSVTAKRLWYDTVGHGSLEALRCAHAAFGAERLVYGSDYPFQVREHYQRSVTYVQEAGFPTADVKKILDTNGARLLGLEAPG